MTIFYHIGDLEFNASNPQDLKKELEEYFSYMGLMPEVEVLQDYVRVDIDDEKIKKAESLGVKILDEEAFRKLLPEGSLPETPQNDSELTLF